MTKAADGPPATMHEIADVDVNQDFQNIFLACPIASALPAERVHCLN
ncbi:hypothetical protein ACTAQJ_22045 [Arthrobacter sp. alpha11c]